MSEVHIPARFNPPTPPHADTEYLDPWELFGRDAIRGVWSAALPLGAPWYGESNGEDVRIVADQLDSGELGTTPDGPIRVLLGSRTYTPEAARQLGAALVAAADLAEQWQDWSPTTSVVTR